MRKLLVLLLIVSSGWISTINAQNGWEQMASMDVAKGGSQSCTIDNLIYVFGGAIPSIITVNSADVYNTETNEWSKLEDMPLDLYESNAEAVNNKIYLVGGWRTSGDTWITSDSTFEYDPEGDSWMAKQNYPVHTGTNTSCVLNDKIYILGGLHDFADKDTSGQKSVFVYDPSADTWDSIPDMLYERGEGAAASVFDNKIYVFGGLHAISEKPERLYIIGKSEMYDPVSNKWTELADMPVPVVNHTSLVHNEKIYVVGGDSGTFTQSKSYGTNIIQEYNPATNEWRLMKGMPFTRGNMTGQKVGNYLYLFGGYSSSREFSFPKSEVWRFNLDSLNEGCEEVIIKESSPSLVIGNIYTLHAEVLPLGFANKTLIWSSDNESVATVSEDGTVTCTGAGTATITAKLKYGGCSDTYTLTVNEPAWMQMTSMGNPKGGSQSCVIDSMIYVFGGLTNSLPLYSSNSAEVYNTNTNDCSDLTPVPVDLYSTSAGVINDTIYLVGGWRRDGSWITINSTFAYDPETDSWITKQECPKNVGGPASCVLNGKLYLFGGIQGTTGTDISGRKQALVYDPATDAWDSLPDMLYERTFESRACVYDGEIYIIGGIYGEWDTNEKVERYNPGDNTWTELAEMPVPESNHLCLVHNDKIYVFGGDSLWTRSPEDRTFSTNFIQEYDPSTNQWQIMESMPFNRSMMTGQKVGNFVYLIGGYPYNSRDFPSVLSEVWRFNLDSLKEWVVPCTEVLISKNAITLYKGDSHLLSASIMPTYAADRTVSWTSSNEDIATVSPDGNVTAVSGGSVTITASSSNGKCTAACEVTAVIPVTGVSLDQHTLDLENGQLATLIASVFPPDANDPLVNWWSDDDAVATVDENGEVTANSVDSTYIHVSTNDGGFRDSCLLIVTPGTGVLTFQANNISIYPNPTREFLNIQIGSTKAFQVDLTSITGQILRSFNMDQKSFQIDLSSFQKGAYFITIRTDDFVITRKIIKL